MAREGSFTELVPFDDVPARSCLGAELQCCAAMGSTLVQGGLRSISRSSWK